MKIYTSKQNIIKALELTNKHFDNNITFLKLQQHGKYYSVRLRVKDSHKAGAHISFTGRRTISACWHVHGIFFDYLFDVDSQVKIFSSSSWIKSKDENWQDYNIGSVAQPFYLSEACHCYENEYPKNYL